MESAMNLKGTRKILNLTLKFPGVTSNVLQSIILLLVAAEKSQLG